jgi:hypothetical protein
MDWALLFNAVVLEAAYQKYLEGASGPKLDRETWWKNVRALGGGAA